MDDAWPYGKPLPDPSIYMKGTHTMRACNKPVDDGFCGVLVTSYDRGWWRWQVRAWSHVGPHVRRDVTPAEPCPCGHPPGDHDNAGACMHLCDCAWPDQGQS